MANFNGNVSGTLIEETINNSAAVVLKRNEFNPKNYLDTKLKDGENEKTIVIRILPVSDTDGNFRIAVKTHNLKVSRRIANSGFKSFLCLNDPQVPEYDPNIACPICAKAQYYFNEAKKCRETNEVKSKQYFMKACMLKSKTTYIVRVIERGKEDEGVKFWRFNENSKGQGIYDALLSLYKQRKVDMMEEGIENYNIFDLTNGRDIVLNLKKTVRADGKEGVAIQITDKSVNKPLTTDVELGNAWISDAKKWFNAYTVKSRDYLSIVADELIPIYDRSLDRFVGMTEEDVLDFDRKREEYKRNRAAALEAASEALAEPKRAIEESTPQQTDSDAAVNDYNPNDLPF